MALKKTVMTSHRTCMPQNRKQEKKKSIEINGRSLDVS